MIAGTAQIRVAVVRLAFIDFRLITRIAKQKNSDLLGVEEGGTGRRRRRTLRRGRDDTMGGDK